MSRSERNRVPKESREPARVTGGVLLAAACVVLGGLWAPAVASDPSSDASSSDRAMVFVEKSVEATELFNQGRLAEATVQFEELLRDYGDLDEDGYIALSLADCLLGQGRHDEARSMYRAVAAAHSGLAEVVQQRLWEAALQGQPDELTIAELRAAAATESEHAYSIRVLLGRALQKQAMALLGEAMDAFRSAAETEPAIAQPTRRLVAGQAEMVAELREDLVSLINRIERAWAGMKTLREIVEAKDDSNPPLAEYQAGWTSSQTGLAPVRVEARLDGCGSVQATANGQPIKLNHTQNLIIRRHQERINAILMEAMQAGGSSQNVPQ